MLAKFVRNLCQVRESIRVVRVQDAARVHRALLRLAEILEGVRKRAGAEEHLAVLQQHAHVFRQQRPRFAHGNAICDVGGSEWSSAAAAKIEVPGEQLQAHLQTRMRNQASARRQTRRRTRTRAGRERTLMQQLRSSPSVWTA